MYQKFETYEVALQWAAALRPCLDAIVRRDPDLGRQLRRAVASVPLNLAEGAQRRGKDRMHLYRIAAGSAAEARPGCGWRGRGGSWRPRTCRRWKRWRIGCGRCCGG